MRRRNRRINNRGRIQRRNRNRSALYFQWRLAEDRALDAAQATPEWWDC